MLSHWPFFIKCLRSETFKLTSVKMGCIKGDGNIEKKREFSGKKYSMTLQSRL